MDLPNARATLSPKVAASDYVYFQRDLTDRDGLRRSADQATGVFTRDYAGNVFQTGKLYCFCASSPTVGDDAQIGFFNAAGQAVVYQGQGVADPASLSPAEQAQLNPISAVVTPSYEDVLAVNPNSDRGYRHGPGQQRSPAIVSNVQRFAVSFFSGVEDIWIEATIGFDAVVALIFARINLGIVLAGGNVTRNGFVVGSIGLFKRVRNRSFTKMPIFVDAVIDGSDGYYIEEGLVSDVVRNGFNTLDDMGKVEVGQAIRDILFPGQQTTPIGLQAGRITGVRCITIPDGTVASGDTSRVKLSVVADTATIAHTLGTTLFTQLIFDATGRPNLNAWVDAIDAFHVRFNNPGVSGAFTGELHLTKRLN